MDEAPKENWLFTVAAKKVAWAGTKLAFSLASKPVVVSSWNHTTSVLNNVGVHITIDSDVLNKALPGVIFLGLVAAHDYAKVKLGWKFL